MYDITKDPDFTDIYIKIPAETAGDPEMAEERRFFMSHVDDMRMQLTFFQKKVEHYKEAFIIDADYSVSSIVSLLDDSLDHTGYERLKVWKIGSRKCPCLTGGC
jgi:hypothetical protein